MPHSGCSALHGVSPNLKKKTKQKNLGPQSSKNYPIAQKTYLSTYCALS